MKRIMLLASIIILLGLVACAKNTGINQGVPHELMPAPQQETVPAKEETPQYLFENTFCAEKQIHSDSGEMIGYYTYEFPQMRIGNEDRLPEAVRATALRSAEIFNARMSEILEEAVLYGDEMLLDQKLLVEEEYAPFVACDEVTSGVYQSGRIVTVASRCYYYGGGAHPYSYTLTYTFDLSAQQFIDPAQIGDDPEGFRTTAAELLIAQAESLGEDYTEGYWPDYRDIISRWNETAVIFDENGMTVLFSAYELGPYAMGPVELTLTYEALADAIGEGGLVHLGVLP